MMEILVNNKGFKWYKRDNINAKGYFFYENIYYSGGALINVFNMVTDYVEFIEIVKKLNGCFSVVIVFENEIWLAVDRARSFPLFYSKYGQHISDSAEELRLLLELDDDDIDEISLAEMVLSYNVINNNTVYNKIGQLQLGQTAIVTSNNVDTHYYFKHKHVAPYSHDREVLLEKFSTVTENVFNRLIESVQGNTIVIPLSGGYDSRYIVAMLKKKGYKNVICYTYGNKDTYEVIYSKAIAEALGYEWHFVEYTEERWNLFFKDRYQDYFNFSHNHCSVPHIQDFIALDYLKRIQAIPEDAIIVTGFCGDLPAGSFVLGKENEKHIQYSFNWLAEYIFKQHYVNTRYSEKIMNSIIARIKEYLLDMNCEFTDFESFTSLNEAWFVSARPSKWVVNSNRVYEFFGNEWRMPLWDNEFLEFWYSVSSDFRYSCNLYKEWLFDKLFNLYKIDMKKPSTEIRSVTYKYTLKSKVRNLIYRLIIFISFKLGVNIINRNSVNNYNKAAITLYRKLKNKKMFNYRFESVHQLMSLWWCEEMYGDKKIKSIFRNEH